MKSITIKLSEDVLKHLRGDCTSYLDCCGYFGHCIILLKREAIKLKEKGK